ncbi:MAG: Z1 domain-containing protein, partial [Peptostreptococcaceae bacterium]
FGPQQIFGAYDSTYNGLSIINDVQENEVASLKSGKMPKSMKEAICWFICTVAIFRFWDLKKPLTMLIHTSSTQQQHAITKNMIENFFNSITNTIDFVNEIEKVYNTQCSKFTKEDFRNQYNDYGISDENINDYPIFDNIRPLITELVEAGLTHINIAYDGQLEFKDNLHLCIDNCYSSKSEDDEYLRLAYPRTMERAKAFIVVGGATLSRGLTLEGLTTSYFIRSSKQADSLMQMGRWFGYRKKYELLPRIWFTNQTLEQFKYLSELDEDLRKELASMGMYGKNPAEYGPRIKKLPKVSELSISAKNKTQRMVEFDIDYSGVGGQTTLLYKDEDIIDSNYDVTIDFINGLGKTNNGDFVNSNNNSSHVWLNVDFNSVFKYLSLMKVPQGNNFTRNFDSIKEWYETQFNNGLMNNFNVVLYGLKTKKTSISLENIELNLSSRSPFDDPSTLIYKFGVITDPKALTMDIDQSNVNLNENEKMSSKEYRNKAKYDKTPVLVLYVINKYSETKNVEKDNFGNKRVPLEASNHLVAYDFYIPQGDSNEKHRSTITVKIENDISKVDNEESE